MTILWYSSKHSYSQQYLEQECYGCRNGERLESLISLAELLDVELRLLQSVDFLVYVLQFRRICGAIEITVCGRCNVGEHLGVDLNGHIHILHSASHRHRVGSNFIGAHTDGVNPDAKTLCYLGSSHRRYVAHIVTSVGEQYHYLALGLRAFKTGDGIGKSHT